MTVIEAIQEANEEAEIRLLKFADIQELNTFIAGMSFEDYPVNVVVPFDDNGTRRGGLRKSRIPLQGWVLTPIADDTEDFRSIDIEDKYIRPMRTLAKTFLTKLLETDVVDPEVEDVSDSIRPEYAFLSQRLFGVSYTMNLPVVESAC